MSSKGPSLEATPSRAAGGATITPGLDIDAEGFKRAQYDFVFDFLEPGPHYQTGQLGLAEAIAALRCERHCRVVKPPLMSVAQPICQAPREVPCALLDSSEAGSAAGSRSRPDFGSTPGAPSPAVPAGRLVEEGTTSHSKMHS